MMEMKKYFSDLVDSRDNRGLRHTLVDIVVMSIYALNRLLYVYFLFILRLLSIFISGLLFLGMYTLLHFHILWLCF